MNSTKQNEVLKYLRTVESANITEIYNNVSFGYYASQNKNLGKLLSGMVKNGMIIRIKKGYFKLNTEHIKPIRNDNFKDLPKLF